MIAIQFIYLLSLVIWIGSIIFFSFFTAPAVFKTLDREKAGKLVGIIFPRYYAIDYICGILSISSLIIGAKMVPDARFFLLTVMAGCTFYAGLVVGPRAKNLKEEIKFQSNPQGKDALKLKFDKTHALSVRLNGTILVLGLGLLWITAGSLKF